MCVLGQPEPIGSVLTFPSGYDTLENSWVKATAVSVRLRILFVTLQNTNNLPLFFRDRMNKINKMELVALRHDYEGRGLEPYSRGKIWL